MSSCTGAATPTASNAGPTLAKCCLLERGMELDGSTAVVPWGSNLDEIRSALRRLTGVARLDEATVS